MLFRSTSQMGPLESSPFGRMTTASLTPWASMPSTIWARVTRPPGSGSDLLVRLNKNYKTLSKGQKQLAAYITENYDRAAFITASKMGRIVGVSESTVVRFAMHLGYRGYPEFQSALEELVRNKLNSIQRMEVTYGRISQSKILESVLKSDAEKINSTLEKIDQAAVEISRMEVTQ